MILDIVLVWLVTFTLSYWIFKNLKDWQSLPPGPWGLPIIGYLPFIDSQKPHLTLTKLAKRYGPIYGMKMGGIYAVVLSDHKLVREAFSKDSLSGRAPLYLTHGIFRGNGIICAEGALWKDQRKLVTAWLKGFGMSKHSVSREKLERRIASGVFELLNDIEKSSGAIDLSQIISNSLGNVLNEIVFGFKFPADDKTWHWLRHIQEEGCREMGVAGVVNFLPFVRFFSPSIRNASEIIQRGMAQTHRLYVSIIARRRRMLALTQPKGAEYRPYADMKNGLIKCIKYSKNATQNEEHFFDPKILIPTDGECILDNFLLEQKQRFRNGDERLRFMKDEQLVFLLADIFGAGLDTTSVTISWFLLYMALYPEEQELIRQEICSVQPETKEVDYTNLPHLMAALCEVQRIRSIVPVGIPHGCIQETVLANYKIPKKTMVVALQWAIHMDPNVWEKPEEFKPGRFLGPDGSLLKPQELIPFQTGKRICPGEELFRMLACGLLARLLRRKRIRLACEPPSPEDMQGTVGVTLTPPEVLFYCDNVQ